MANNNGNVETIELDDCSVIERSRPWGLSDEKASRKLLDAVQRELITVELQSSKIPLENDTHQLVLSNWLSDRLSHRFRLKYFATEDGLLSIICIITFIGLFLLTLSIESTRRVLGSSGWTYAFNALVLFPYVLFNMWLYGSRKQTERFRAFAQVREALLLFEKSFKVKIGKTASTRKVKRFEKLFLSSHRFHNHHHNSHHGSHEAPVHLASEYEIPSCTLVSVLRAGEWKRLPPNLIVRGDIIKIFYGNPLPCDAIRVSLRYDPTRRVDKVAGKANGSKRSSFVSGGPKDSAAHQFHNCFVLKYESEIIKRGTTTEPPVPQSFALHCGLYVAVGEPATLQVRKFLEMAIHGTDEKGLLRPIYILLIVLCAVNVLIRLALALRMTYYDTPSTTFPAPMFPSDSIGTFTTTPLLLLIIFSPLVGKLGLNVTDIWGNARLQSHFLFHHERQFSLRFPDVLKTRVHKLSHPVSNNSHFKHINGRYGRSSDSTGLNVRGVFPDVSSSESSTSSSATSDDHSLLSETGLSRPSSADSEMSISRVPIRQQLQEIRSVFRQGLDGKNNLLHVLNATTYLCFLDYEGLLLEKCRRIQEVCVLSDEQHCGLSSESWKAKDCPPTTPFVDQSSPLNSFQEGLCSDDLQMPSSRIRPVVLSVTSTDRDEGFLRHRHDSSSDGGEAAVLADDTSKSRKGSRSFGEKALELRFVDEVLGSKMSNLIRPLSLAAKVTQLPPNQMMRFESVGWLHTLRMLDFFQQESSFISRWNECLCSLADLTQLENCNMYSQIRYVIAPIVCWFSGEGKAHRPYLDGFYWLTIQCRHVLYIDSSQARAVEEIGRRTRRYCEQQFQRTSSPSTAKPLPSSTAVPSPEVASSGLEPLSPRTRFNYHTVKSWPFMLSALVKNIRTNDVMLFCKAKPEDLIRVSKYCYANDRIVPLDTKIVSKLNAVIMQWASDGFDCFAFGYSPLSRKIKQYLLHGLEEQSVVQFVNTHETPKDDHDNKSSSDELDSSENFKPWCKRALCVVFPGFRSIGLRREPWIRFTEDASEAVTDKSLLDLLSAPAIDPSIFVDYTNVLYKSDNFLRNAASRVPLQIATKGLDMLFEVIKSSTILLGLIALKARTPPAVPARLQDFQAAGVRVNLFLPYRFKMTRHIGRILGLDAGWNSIVSLDEGDRDAIYVNQCGNEVLPAGIERIKAHIKNVDDIPLLVSLYANSTPATTLEMIDILQNRDEVVTCIGSALRTSNFDLFSKAACPVSILSLPYPLCNECHGRRDVGSGASYYTPILLSNLSFSAALTSLHCALQAHAAFIPWEGPQTRPLTPVALNRGPTEGADYKGGDLLNCGSYPEFLLQLMYSSFQEARRIVASIEMLLANFILNSSLIGLIMTIQNLLSIVPILSGFDAICIVFVYLPAPSVCLFLNPVREDIMVEFPHKFPNSAASLERSKAKRSSCSHEKYQEEGNQIHHRHTSAWSFAAPTASLYLLRILVPLCGTFVFGMWILYLNVQIYAEYGGGPSCRRKRFVQTMLNGELSACIRELETQYHYNNTIPEVSVATLTLIYCFTVSLGFVNKFDSMLVLPPWKNKAFLHSCGCVVLLHILIVIVRILPVYNRLLWPHVPFYWWIGLCASVITTAIVTEFTRHSQKKKHQQQQKFLKLIFHTRLGMWSPK